MNMSTVLKLKNMKITYKTSTKKILIILKQVLLTVKLNLYNRTGVAFPQNHSTHKTLIFVTAKLLSAESTRLKYFQHTTCSQ